MAAYRAGFTLCGRLDMSALVQEREVWSHSWLCHRVLHALGAFPIGPGGFCLFNNPEL